MFAGRSLSRRRKLQIPRCTRDDNKVASFFAASEWRVSIRTNNFYSRPTKAQTVSCRLTSRSNSVANGKNNHPRPSLCGRPEQPSTPEAIRLLRILLSQRTANLQAITQAIESDLGLTVRIFELAARMPATVPPGVFDISEIVVHLGLKQLRAMICHYPRNSAMTS
jgi:HDOD domain